MQRRTIALIGAVALFALAGCTAGAPSPEPFEAQSSLVQNVSEGPENETVTLVLTGNAQYSEQVCDWNPALEMVTCDPHWYNTNISTVTVTHNGTVVEEYAQDANYENTEIVVEADEPGVYGVKLDLESGDTATIQFNKTASGDITDYRAPR